MLITTGAIALGFVLAYIILTSRKTDPNQLNETRASLPMVGIQIICGDCSGEDFRPQRTYLDRFGSCSQCGGQSYVLATSVYTRDSRIGTPFGLDRRAGGGRVLAFDSRANKIAV